MERTKAKIMCLAACLSIGLLVIAGLGANAAPGKAAPRGARAAAIKAPRPAMPGPSLARGASAEPAALAGQTRTLLPDGRWLLLGGASAAGPVAAAALREAGAGMAVAPTTFGALRHPRAWHTATLLPDGTVLVAGGIGPDGQVVRTTELFDPETQQFRSLVGTSSTPRAYHSATLLTEGLVLIAGGISEKGEPLQQAELWDPRTQHTTKLSATLAAARLGHTARLLPDGTVLLTGGASSIAGAPLQQDEIFDPQSRSFSPCTAAVSAAGPCTAGPAAAGPAGPPHLAASIPADAAENVPLDAFIALRFSKPLWVKSVDTNAIRLAGPSGPVEAKLVPAEAGMLVFITPKDALAPATTYTLTIAGPVDQEYISVSYASFSFSTAAAAGGNAADGPDWVPGGQSWTTGWPDSKWRALPPLQALPGQTALAGQVLQLNGQPLENVTLSIDNTSTRSDATGRFLLAPLTPGHHELVIEGATANQPGKKYGRFEAGVDIVAGKTNVLPYTIWMQALDWPHAVKIPSPTVTETVVTTPRIPGLELRLPAGSVITAHDGSIATELTVTAVPLDRPPFPLPSGVRVPIYFTIQPGGAYISTGARLIYPNTYNSRPGTVYDFWNYDPDARGWYIYGYGKVSADGKQIVPDPGVMIWELSGAMVGVPGLPPPNGPPPGGPKRSGDPVDPATGLFVLENTDLYLPDILPISLTRTYRQQDTRSRPFGIGATHNYEIFLIGDSSTFTYIDLILADGGRIHYVRTSPGTGWTDAVMTHTSTPTGFYGSTIAWNGHGWNLKLKNGTTYVFPEAAGATNPSQAALIGITDRYGNTLSLTRDPSTFNLLRITTPNGRWVAFSYDASNRVTQATDNIGRTVGYTYDGSGRLWKVTDPAGGITTYTYDNSHNLLTITDPRNITWLTNQYDVNNRVTKQTLADNSFWQFAYTLDGNGNVTQTDVTDPRGNTHRATFNSSGYATSDIYALGKPEQIAIAKQVQTGTNLTTTVTDPLGRNTTYGYDTMGNVTSVTRMYGTQYAATTAFTYEPSFNQVATITDPLNHTTTFTYDSNGNISSTTDPLSNQTTFAYNSLGQLISVTNALSKTTSFGYDSGDLVSTTDPLGNQARRFLDGGGRLLSSTNALGQTTYYQYDALNRLTRITDPLNGATAFTYDANGNLLTVTDARNNATTYVYNNMDRVTSRTDPLTRAESYQYDGNGNLTQFTDRRGKIDGFTYDALNRRTFAGFGSTKKGWESTINYTYDAGSRLTQLVDSSGGTITRTYDNFDRLASETTPQGSISYVYDAAGRRASMTVAGQQAVNYSYDNADRLTQMTQLTTVVGFSYDAASRRTLLTLPNGITVSYTYDDAWRLTSMIYQLGQTQLGNVTYTYDNAGRVTAKGGTWARTNLPAAVASATYDAANELTNWGGTNLSYDANGNITSPAQHVTYTWNARNQLTSVPGGTFQYDGFGRRQVRGTTSFLYDGLNPVQELSGSTVTANTLAGGLDEFFTRTDSAGARSLLPDLLGSTLALTDNTGTVQTQYTYEPFGNTTFTGVSSANPFQFTGRENDSTGLYYYRARYYSPTLGRFISEDPWEFFGGDMDLYSYATDAPSDETDPGGTYAGAVALPWYTLPWAGGSAAEIATAAGLGALAGVDLALALYDADQLYRLIQNYALSRDPAVGQPLRSSTLGGDDPAFASPEAAREKIREIENDLKNPDLDPQERSKLQRRLKELRRRASKRAHGADKNPLLVPLPAPPLSGRKNATR